MFYRRKILLSLITASGGSIEKLRLQKILFLACRKQAKPSFHFVPYKYGCFSFQANADLSAMEKMGVLEEKNNTWKLKTVPSSGTEISAEDSAVLSSTLERFNAFSTKDIIRHTYLTFPYYALKSQLVSKLLTIDEQKKVKASIDHETSPLLLSIGYEGKSLEEFVNILLKGSISLLCDVRKNALSMKYGFSKSTLSNACLNVGIEYRHYPELGIESADRKSLETREDYESLFLRYRKTVLVRSMPGQKILYDDIQEANRAAVMCFEADPSMCHRTHLINNLIRRFNDSLPVRNG